VQLRVLDAVWERSSLQTEGNAKLVADQLGHSLDVSVNVYTQSPVEKRLEVVNGLERCLNGVQEKEVERKLLM
jgi:hypothetical protein